MSNQPMPSKPTEPEQPASKGSSVQRLVGRVAVLSVACNDEYGSSSSKAERIEVEWPEHNLTFGPVYADATARITWGKGWIRIAGIKINAVGPAYHVGNIYWNAWHVRTDELWAMLTHRRFCKWFSLEEGECEVWEKYEADCPPNVKEHAPLSAGASVDHRVGVEVTENHVNRAADGGCCVSSCWAL